MTSKKTYLLVFVVAQTVTGVLAASPDASASFTRRHGSACQPIGGVPIDSGFAIENDSTTARMVLLCPVNDSDNFPQTTVLITNVHGQDGNNQPGFPGRVLAFNCRVDAFSVSGTCSPSAISSDTGVGSYTLSPQTSGYFTTVTDFTYTAVSLPTKTSSGSRSGLRGHFVSSI